MAEYFVWHGSAQDDSDVNWNSSTLAFLDIDTALGTAGAGDTVWVAHDHAKTYSADTVFNNSGAYNNPVKIICVNRTTGALANTAEEKTTGTSYSMNFADDYLYIRGVKFGSGDFIGAYNDVTNYLEDSTVELVSNAGDYINLGQYDGLFVWRDVTVKFNNSGQALWFGGGSRHIWDGGGVDTGGTAINRLFRVGLGAGGHVIWRNLDLSNITTEVIQAATRSYGVFTITLVGCKLPSGVSLVDDDPLVSPWIIDAISCDNGNGFYYFDHRRLEGKIQQATNCHLNFKYDGTNYCSAKMVSNINALDARKPLRYKLAEFWSDSANPTVTVETITDGVTLQDDEFWVEIESPDATDEALRNIDRSSRQTVGWSGGSGPGTPSNLTTSTESWTEDLTSEVKQKVAVTISGGAAGPHTVWACLAKPSTTVYVCPEVTVS